MHIKSFFLLVCMTPGLLLHSKNSSAHDEWKIAVGAGAIIAGGALLWHGISEYNTRASLADDKASVDTVYELTQKILQRYRSFIKHSLQYKEKLAQHILSSGSSIEAFVQQLEHDNCRFDQAIARLETNYDYWARAEERVALRRRAEDLLQEGHVLQRQMHDFVAFVQESVAYLILFELVGRPSHYFNPNDPFQNIHAADAMDVECKELLRAISCLERSRGLDQEDRTLLARAEKLVDGLEKQRDVLMTSTLYTRELQLKLQDEREQERIAIQRRLAKAEEEKAHALSERNRIEEQARWQEERELARVRERLARVENRLRELKRKTENPPCSPESEEFYLWIRGELTSCDC
jgi:hypothetical protein